MSEQKQAVRNPKNVTRQTILATAFDMYVNGLLIPGDEKLVAVLDALGLTTGAGSQIWNNQASFREDLAAYIVENLPPIVPDPTKPLPAAIADAWIGSTSHRLLKRWQIVQNPSAEIADALEARAAAETEAVVRLLEVNGVNPAVVDDVLDAAEGAACRAMIVDPVAVRSRLVGRLTELVLDNPAAETEAA